MRSFILLTLFSVIGLIDQAVIDPGTNSDNKEVEDGSIELTEIDNQNIIEDDASIDNNAPDNFNSDVNFGSTEESPDQHQNHSEGSSGNVHVPPNAIPYCYPYPYTSFQSPEERSMSQGIGWAAATAILIFAFSNTVIVGATVVVTYVLYQVLISALAVVAPEISRKFLLFLYAISNLIWMVSASPFPQQVVLQSQVPQNPIEPPNEWAWGAAGFGYGYRAKQTHDG